jgi:hypothetical protein
MEDPAIALEARQISFTLVKIRVLVILWQTKNTIPIVMPGTKH